MHIPDGFLSPGVSVALLGVAVGFFVHSLKQVRQKLLVKERKAALVTAEGLEIGSRVKRRLTQYGRTKIQQMALVASVVFVMQMFDLYIYGTPVHILGGAMAAIILGPLEGFIVITIVLVIQALALADGGLLALGANIVNMGLIGGVGGYYIYKRVKERSKITWLSIFLATWLSVVVAAIIYATEISIFDMTLAGVSAFNIVAAHFVFGLGEAIFTLAIVNMVKKWE